MFVNKIQSSSYSQCFCAQNNSKQDYENPISRKTEKNLAILTSIGGAAVGGAIGYGIVSTFAKRNVAGWVGAAVAGIILALTLPAKVYNAKVGAFAREKEMDVFSRDRELKSGLTEQVHEEVKNPEVSLDKKLDDNLKLQMANKGMAVGLANITAQAQG